MELQLPKTDPLTGSTQARTDTASATTAGRAATATETSIPAERGRWQQMNTLNDHMHRLWMTMISEHLCKIVNVSSL
jgi:hypothetical protein